MLVSVHVPKTAGSSFVDILREDFGDTLAVDFSFPEIRLHSIALEALYPRSTFTFDGDRNRIRCFHGHFKASTLFNAFPNATYCIWFRDPLQRCLSHYYAAKRKSPWFRWTGMGLLPEGLGLRLFIRLRATQNYYSRILERISLSQFDFIGITEEFNRSLELFDAKIGEHPRTTCPRLNVNPNKSEADYTVPADMRALFERFNRLDTALYQEAARRFEAMYAKHCRAGPGILARLAP